MVNLFAAGIFQDSSKTATFQPEFVEIRKIGNSAEKNPAQIGNRLPR
jgi:hypothetical protein